MKSYRGSRTIDGIAVTVDELPLAERYDLKKFTDSGFEWTYEGKEPAQLALALLADHFVDDEKALALCDGFMKHVVANFENDWQLNSEEIEKAVAEVRAN